jgi:hypothetical protein
MAKKTVVTPIDDIDGSQEAETVEFGIDGFLYSVDLSAAHAEALRDRLTAYREFGTRLGKLQPRSALTNLRSTPRRPGDPERKLRYPPLGRGERPADQSSLGVSDLGD